MEQHSPVYLRARIDLIRELITLGDPTSNDIPILRNGVFPSVMDEHALVKQQTLKKDYSNEKLSFTELCTFNTWFTLHPEKVCGKQEITSSREFPITIKGDKQWVVNTITHGLGDNKLITELPGDWCVVYFDPALEDFDVDYTFSTYKIRIFSHGVDYNFQIHNGDHLLENINYREIQDANSHALQFMRAHSLDHTNPSILEMEALAFELELQIINL